MKIVVAGAGAGKTTSMAEVVLDKFREIKDGKIIYVVTYTNAARDRIRDKITELNGFIPKQILIETIHSFLLKEFIFPFHHLLFKQQFSKVSLIKLSDNPGFKASKIKELSTHNIIHVEKVSQTAKWVVCRKSGDKKITRDKRKKILAVVHRYLDSVFVDEAQDIDEHLVEVIETLHDKGINICLVGDPKQDLRGRNAFTKIISTYKELVEYKQENHRCPISHVGLANNYIIKEEQQLPQKSQIGKVSYLFESDISIKEFVNSKEWDLAFIYKKNDRFLTHENDKSVGEQSLSYELSSLIKKSAIGEKEIEKYIYNLKKRILSNIGRSNNFAIFKQLELLLSIELTKQDKGKLGSALDLNRESLEGEGVLVNSIDKIKGLEGNRCLFILTPDLASYLFLEKADRNKMMNYLYVALTRSKEELVFLVTNEVEDKYSRDIVITFFKHLNIKDRSSLIKNQLQFT